MINHSQKHIAIVAGETSGDTHAAHLVEEIKKLNPNIRFSGLGGPKMQAAGVEIHEDLTKMAVIGFIEVIKHYKQIRRIFYNFLERIEQEKPDAVILVDYPGFNLRLAKALKKMDIKVIYYISPQIWAWKESRIKAIKAYVDKMLVLFSFEKDFYAKHQMTVDFVGHPLVDTVRPDLEREEILNLHNLSAEKITIGILPGSRQKEIESILPAMLRAADHLKRSMRNLQFILIKAPNIPPTLIDDILHKNRIKIKIIENDSYNAIHACDICMVTSGTATLETAILIKPMVVIYKTSFITWLLAKALIKLPYIGLVNVVAGYQVVPECIQHKANGENIANEIIRIFSDEETKAEMEENLRRVKQSLGGSGASQNAAKSIVRFLGAN